MNKFGLFLFLLFFTFTAFKVNSQNFRTVYPKDGQFISDGVEFRWNNYDNASNYIVEFYDDSSSTNLVHSVNVEVSSVKLSLSIGTYYWKVYGVNNGLVIDSTQTKKIVVFDPISLNNLNLWLKSDTGVILQSGKVSNWIDVSDSSVNVSQSNATKQPLLVFNALNGYPVVDFDANDDAFNVGLDLSVNSFLISIVYNVHENSSKGIRLIDGQNNWLIGPHNALHRGFNGSFFQGKGVVVDQFVTQSVFVKNDATKNYLNDSLFGQNIASYSPGSFITIGDNKGINCGIAEIIILKGNVEDSIRQNIDK